MGFCTLARLFGTKPRIDPIITVVFLNILITNLNV